MMLHTKYQVSRSWGLIQEYSFHDIPISLCKTCDPQGGPISLAPGAFLNKLGRGPLDDV